MESTTRPSLLDVKTGQELHQWYWLKAELVDYCKTLNLSYSGNKAEIKNRIANYLDGKKISTKKKKSKQQSTFNWAKEILTPATIITDSYTNGPNSRRFFKDQLGPKFSFNIDFMQWMKENTGKTLADAVEAWKELEARKKDKNFESKIPASNQYNRYTRDFFKANPGRSLAEARAAWAYKKSIPGHNRYEDGDLDFI